MSGNATRERILDAAETLFAEHGFDATSLRTITSAAEANVAAVNYHFGSKDALIEHVLARRLEPLNSARLRLLDACERDAGHRPVPLETILECFLGPMVRMHAERQSGSGRFVKMFGRFFTEPSDHLRELFVRQFAEVARRFKGALARALPELDEEDLAWRMHFMIGAMAHTISNDLGLALLAGGAPTSKDPTATLERLIRFVAAGMRAPAAVTSGDAP